LKRYPRRQAREQTCEQETNAGHQDAEDSEELADMVELIRHGEETNSRHRDEKPAEDGEPT
jgi:hypothetical protein